MTPLDMVRRDQQRVVRWVFVSKLAQIAGQHVQLWKLNLMISDTEALQILSPLSISVKSLVTYCTFAIGLSATFKKLHTKDNKMGCLFL